MSSLLIRNVRLNAGEATDILVRDGKIAAIGKGLSAEGAATEDGNGHIMISGLVEAHTHLDKSVWGMPWHVNAKSATLRERIDFEREKRLEIGIDPHRQSMRQAIMLAANGASHIRSHVDIDTTHGLRLMVDPISARYLRGASIDYQQDNMLAGAFKIDNPNAVASCGCGHSFRAKDAESASEYEDYDEGYAGGGCGHCGHG